MTAVDYSQWRELIISNSNGYGYFFILVVLFAVISIMLFRRYNPLSDAATFIRMVAVVVFFALFAITTSVNVAVLALLLTMALLSLKVDIPISDYILLAVLAAVVRAPSLFNDHLWYDETFTAALAQLNYRDMLTVIMSDVHPIGWYTIEWVIVRTLGTGEWALRLPAYVAGIGLVLASYRLCITMKFPRRTAMMCGLLLVMLPAQIYYSAEARAYSLMALIVIVAVIAILERRVKLFSAMIAALPLLHALGYIYAAVLGLSALAYHKRKSWAVGSVPSALIGGAWIPVMLQQTSDIADGFWLVWTPLSGLSIFTRMLVSWHVEGYAQLLVYGVIIGFNVIALYVCRKWIITQKGMLWLSVVFLPPLIATVISATYLEIFLDRAFIGSMTLLVIAWAYTITHVAGGNRFATYLILLPILMLTVSAYFWGDMTRAPMGDYIERGCDGADYIYNVSVHNHIITTYYDAGGLESYLWTGANDINQSLKPHAKQALGWTQLDYPPDGVGCFPDLDTLLTSVEANEHLYDILADDGETRSKTFFSNQAMAFNIHVSGVNHAR